MKVWVIPPGKPPRPAEVVAEGKRNLEWREWGREARTASAGPKTMCSDGAYPELLPGCVWSSGFAGCKD